MGQVSELHGSSCLLSPSHISPEQDLNLVLFPPPQVALQADQEAQSIQKFWMRTGQVTELHISCCPFSPSQKFPEQDLNLDLFPPPQVALQADQKAQSNQMFWFLIKQVSVLHFSACPLVPSQDAPEQDLNLTL